MEEIHASSGTEPQDVAGGPTPIMTAQNLIDALSAAAPSPTILLQNREYKVDQPLLVPDGVTVQGVGEMQFEGGLPTGFKPGTATTITAKETLAGNLLTLCNGSKVERRPAWAQPAQHDDGRLFRSQDPRPRCSCRLGESVRRLNGLGLHVVRTRWRPA